MPCVSRPCILFFSALLGLMGSNSHFRYGSLVGLIPGYGDTYSSLCSHPSSLCGGY